LERPRRGRPSREQRSERLRPPRVPVEPSAVSHHDARVRGRNDHEREVQTHVEGHVTGPGLPCERRTSAEQERVAEVVYTAAAAEQPFSGAAAPVLGRPFPDVPCVLRLRADAGPGELEEDPQPGRRQEVITTFEPIEGARSGIEASCSRLAAWQNRRPEIQAAIAALHDCAERNRA